MGSSSWPANSDRPVLVGEMIRDERRRRGLTQDELAAIVGVSQSEIARWETGKVRNISFETRERLADAGFDRSVLGLHGFDDEKLAADIEAAWQLSATGGRPRLALSVIGPDMAWMEQRWGPAGSRVGQRELGMLADARFVAGLALTLTGRPGDQARARYYLSRAEMLYHRVREDIRRLSGLSDVLLLQGNEQRKSGSNEDAVYLLAKASSFADRAGLSRRSAECNGLSAYAYAELGDWAACQAVLDRAEQNLDSASAPATTAQKESLFTHGSLKEVRLRCACRAARPSEWRPLIGSPSFDPDMNQNWKCYYAVTAGIALAMNRDPNCIQWIKTATTLALETGLYGQLIKLSIVLAHVPGNEATDLRAALLDNLANGTG